VQKSCPFSNFFSFFPFYSEAVPVEPATPLSPRANSDTEAETRKMSTKTLPLGTQADSLVDHDIESGGNLRVSVSVGTVFNDGMSDDSCDTHDDVNGQQKQRPAPHPFSLSLMLLVNPSIRGRTRLIKGIVEHQFLPLLVNVVQVPLESFFYFLFFFPFPYYSVAVEPVTPLSPAQRKRKLSTGAKTLSHTRKNFY
jgi:hypothetical protein